ncbi:hypothetical protein GCM10010082_25560 [Kushneria pakistanensis]|uniref:Uncharacterized protein n=1 Tax=Kushneria pakistanensis TaxID=1508770 RepID=A0ABQ3FMF4_9GAMM|nr:hypothetical protein [Kushneria pakistanensis]GHC30367.1 hypothetical protein GCM10010082_25560 [Kushneria pakistanensis]
MPQLTQHQSQSFAFTRGGDQTFVLTDNIDTLELNAQFNESRARSGETLSASAQGDALETLMLSGNGRIEWDNSAIDTTAVAYTDASALEGGLEYTASADVQETIVLGGSGNGADVLYFSEDASRYGQEGDGIDTLVGFDGMQDTLFVDGEIMASFETINFDHAVTAWDAESLEEAFTMAGEMDSGDAVIPVFFKEDFYLYRDSGPAGLDENDFVLRLSDLAGGPNTFSDRRDMISKMAPAPEGPFTDVLVEGTVNGTENTPDSFVLGDDDAWWDSVITDFELGIDRIDVSGLTGTDGEPLGFDDIRPMFHGDGTDLLIDDGSGFNTVTLIGVPKYDSGAPLGELAYALNAEDFLFA